MQIQCARMRVKLAQFKLFPRQSAAEYQILFVICNVNGPFQMYKLKIISTLTTAINHLIQNYYIMDILSTNRKTNDPTVDCSQFELWLRK